MRRAAAWFHVSVLLAVVAVVLVSVGLPEGRIPMHWGADGQVNRWGDRSEFALVMLAIVAGLGGFLELMRRWAGARMPWSLANIPDREYWARPENDRRGRERIMEDMALVGIWTMVLLVAITGLFAASIHDDSVPSLLIIVGLVIGWTAVLVVAMVRRNRFYRDHP